MFDYIVVGAGFAGAVMAERIATQLKKRVLVIEQRGHIGGNCFDYYNEQGILVHKYGPHIFHTKNKQVWDYLAQFSEWNLYQHHVMGYIAGNLIPIPCNLNSLKQLFPSEMTKQLTSKLINQYGYGAKVMLNDLLASNDQQLIQLADYLANHVFINYTKKQWGEVKNYRELVDYALAKAFIHISLDDRHYPDEYQGIPRYGYTKLFENMLLQPNIKLLLNTDYRELITLNQHSKQIKFMGQAFTGKLIYTGKIDELFDFSYGELSYRNVEFKQHTFTKEIYQSAATILYPNDYDLLRITEMKYLTGQQHPYTTIIEEYSKQCSRHEVPYYPLPTQDQLSLLASYQELAAEYSEIILTGRLANYQFYNMDEVIALSLTKFAQLV
ncbi:MAG: UDP-galactopyranose mutase [Pseudomonadota bacterium]|jgi:UDP-galactopyranose mutase